LSQVFSVRQCWLFSQPNLLIYRKSAFAEPLCRLCNWLIEKIISYLQKSSREIINTFEKSILGDFYMQSPDTSQSGVENYLYRID